MYTYVRGMHKNAVINLSTPRKYTEQGMVCGLGQPDY